MVLYSFSLIVITSFLLGKAYADLSNELKSKPKNKQLKFAKGKIRSRFYIGTSLFFILSFFISSNLVPLLQLTFATYYAILWQVGWKLRVEAN